jgi:hypothetical protein
VFELGRKGFLTVTDESTKPIFLYLVRRGSSPGRLQAIRIRQSHSAVSLHGPHIRSGYWQDQCSSLYLIGDGMSNIPMMQKVANAAQIDETDAMIAVEEFLLQLHKLEYEKPKYGVDFVGLIWPQISARAFFHLLGFIEQFSGHHDWEPGTIGEYLGRMPPCDRWERISEEMKDWKRPSA